MIELVVVRWREITTAIPMLMVRMITSVVVEARATVNSLFAVLEMIVCVVVDVVEIVAR
jgi:hypothetical protein